MCRDVRGDKGLLQIRHDGAGDRPAHVGFVMRRLWAVCIAALTGGLVLAQTRAPAHFASLFHEDGWAEWATFLAFGVAAGLAFDGARRPGERRLRLLLAGVGLFCL